MDNFRIEKEKLKKRHINANSFKEYIRWWMFKPVSYDQYYFFLNLRLFEKVLSKKKGFVNKIRRYHCLRSISRHSNRLGYDIPTGVLGEDVIIYHKASIVINPDAKVGDGCRFHGDCTIGVARTGELGCPVLGKNVDIGTGVRILGDIYIADNIIIGANAVVTKSFYEPGITIAGVPAKKISL